MSKKSKNQIDWETDKWISYKCVRWEADLNLPSCTKSRRRKREISRTILSRRVIFYWRESSSQLHCLMHYDCTRDAVKLHLWITSEIPSTLISRISHLFVIWFDSDIGGVDRHTVIWSSTNVWITSDVNVTAQSFLRWASFASLTISLEASS